MKEEWVKVESLDEIFNGMVVEIRNMICCGRRHRAIVMRPVLRKFARIVTVENPIGVWKQNILGGELLPFCCNFLGTNLVNFNRPVQEGRLFKLVLPPEAQTADTVVKKALEQVR